MKNIIIKFSIGYIVAIIFVTAITAILNIDAGSGTGIASLIGGLYFSAQSFVKREKRSLEKKERLKISLFLLLTSWIISLIMVSFSLLIDDSPLAIIQETGFIFLIIISFFISLVYFLAINFGFNFFVNQQLKFLQKQKKASK